LFASNFVTIQSTVKYVEDQNKKEIILRLILYTCETLSLALREEHKLQIF